MPLERDDRSTPLSKAQDLDEGSVRFSRDHEVRVAASIVEGCQSISLSIDHLRQSISEDFQLPPHYILERASALDHATVAVRSNQDTRGKVHGVVVALHRV